MPQGGAPPGPSGRGGTVVEKGSGGPPRATHASNLLFILSPPLSPLPHGVTSALPGPSAEGPATSGFAGRSGTSARKPGAGRFSRDAGPERLRGGVG